MEKKKILFVVGPANSGKSTIIRCITGCSDRKGRILNGLNTLFCRFKTKNKNEIIIIVAMVSPQEENRKVMPTDKFREWLVKYKDKNLIISLQDINAEEYINVALILNFDCYAVLINPQYSDKSKYNSFDELKQNVEKIISKKVLIIDGTIAPFYHVNNICGYFYEELGF